MRIIYDLVRDGLSAINTAADRLNAARDQVATGRRINSTSDDPLGAEQAIGDRGLVAGLDAYTRARDSASARLAAADSVLSGMTDKITSAIVAGTGVRGTTATASARAAASAAVRGLRDSLAADLNTSFNGSYLFSGTAVDTPAYALVGGVWTYQGDHAATQVEVEKGRLVATTFDGDALARGADSMDLLTALDGLATAIDAGDNDAIGTALGALDRAFDRVLQAQGRLGADERGVDEAAARLSALRLAADTRRSKVEDANVAEAIARLTSADNAYRAALGAVSSAERQSLLDYLR
jgi:flagellar hook-associated protein 3 FlgL